MSLKIVNIGEAEMVERFPGTFLLGCVALLSGLKGLRLPNLWSATQSQIDYSMRIVKRGFFGELMQLFGIDIGHYFIFTCVSFMILATTLLLWYVLLTTCTRNVIYDARYDTLLMVYLSSFSVSYMVHMVGYTDILLLALTVVCLLLPISLLHMCVTYMLCAFGVLFHEIFVVIFFPIIWFRMVLEAVAPVERSRVSLVPHLILLPTFVLILASALTYQASLTEVQTHELQKAILTHVDFKLRPDFFDVMKRSVGDNLKWMLNMYWYDPISWGVKEARAFITLLPVALLFCWCSVVLLIGTNHRRRHVLAFGAVIASLSPLTLQLIGMDWFRWNALAVTNSFMVFLLLRRNFGDRHLDATRWVRSPKVALVIVMLNLSTGDGLFDNYRVKTFPYILELYQCVTQTCMPTS